MIEFNNGFITALMLFVEHRDNSHHIAKDNEGKILVDSRLYGASDHLFDLEVPDNLINGKFGNQARLIKRVENLRKKALEHRLDFFKDSKLSDKLFKEAEDILISLDKLIFGIKRIKINYR